MADNEMEDKQIEEFDIDQAQKLLESIRFMSDMRKFPVQKMFSVTMEMTTMQEWLKQYAKITEWNGRDGTENEVIKMVQNVDSDLQVLVGRVEDGFRRLLTVLDRRELKISLLKNEVEKYKEQIRLMEEREMQIQKEPTKIVQQSVAKIDIKQLDEDFDDEIITNKSDETKIPQPKKVITAKNLGLSPTKT